MKPSQGSCICSVGVSPRWLWRFSRKKYISLVSRDESHFISGLLHILPHTCLIRPYHISPCTCESSSGSLCSILPDNPRVAYNRQVARQIPPTPTPCMLSHKSFWFPLRSPQGNPCRTCPTFSGYTQIRRSSPFLFSTHFHSLGNILHKFCVLKLVQECCPIPCQGPCNTSYPCHSRRDIPSCICEFSSCKIFCNSSRCPCADSRPDICLGGHLRRNMPLQLPLIAYSTRTSYCIDFYCSYIAPCNGSACPCVALFVTSAKLSMRDS